MWARNGAIALSMALSKSEVVDLDEKGSRRLKSSRRTFSVICEISIDIFLSSSES